MIDQARLDRLYECDMIDANGEKIGSVKQVWVDDLTGRPLWAEVNTGLFGLRDHFVPIQDASIGDGRVVVPLAKRQVKESPNISIRDGQMSDEQQEELCRYYGLIPSASTGEHDRLPAEQTRADRPQRMADRAPQGDPAPDQVPPERMSDRMPPEQVAPEQVRREPAAADGPRLQSTVAEPFPDMMDAGAVGTGTVNAGAGEASTMDAGAVEAGEVMTRHEEQLSAVVRDVEVGRVRLVKYVVTEEQNITVPVSREEVRIVREPIDGTTKADRDAFTEAAAEVILHRQEPVVEKIVRPVERVRLEKEIVTEQRQVSGNVRHERLDVEDDTDERRR
ncbi:DUF2382 domain-containing protein [Actinokineospora sp. 24-640]